MIKEICRQALELGVLSNTPCAILHCGERFSQFFADFEELKKKVNSLGDREFWIEFQDDNFPFLNKNFFTATSWSDLADCAYGAKEEFNDFYGVGPKHDESFEVEQGCEEEI